MKRIFQVVRPILLLAIILGIHSADAQWNLSGDNIYNTNTGGVSIGTTKTAGYKLNVNGSVQIIGSLSLYSPGSDATITTNIILAGKYTKLWLGSNNHFGGNESGVYDQNNHNLVVFDYGGNRLHLGDYITTDYNTGNVGIGTTTPGGYKLNVNGNIWGTQISSNAIFGKTIVAGSGNADASLMLTSLNHYGGNESGVYDQNDNNLVVLDYGAYQLHVGDYITEDNNTGNVGISTTDPQYKLDVYGELGVSGNIYAYQPSATNDRLLLGSNGNFSGDEIGIYDETQGSAIAVWDIGAQVYYYADGLIASKNGSVGIGTTHPASKLDVAGGIRADSIVINATGADFVFDKGYKMSSIEELAKYIGENKRLPDVPSAETMQKDGASVGEMQTKLLQKVEELTLYLIEQNKRIKTLEEENLALQIKR